MFTVDEVARWVGAQVTDANGTLDTDASLVLEDLQGEMRELLEDHLDRALLTSSWTLTLDAEDLDGVTEVYLPRRPLISITSVVYYDTANTATTWDSSNYFAVAGDLGRLVRGYQKSWPTSLRDQACMVITYSAGYGTAKASVPGPLRTALKALCMHYYLHRGEGLFTGAGGWKGEVPEEVERILRRVAMYRIGNPA
jgi:uncharacterized phiE125 gp8 family phage protein